jgi:hypothetical protein
VQFEHTIQERLENIEQNRAFNYHYLLNDLYIFSIGTSVYILLVFHNVAAVVCSFERQMHENCANK